MFMFRLKRDVHGRDYETRIPRASFVYHVGFILWPSCNLPCLGSNATLPASALYFAKVQLIGRFTR